MEKQLVLPFGDYKIIARIDDSGMPDIPPEMNIFIMSDDKTVVQDICLVRPHTDVKYVEHGAEIKVDPNHFDCIVWADGANDNATHKHVIGVYKEEE